MFKQREIGNPNYGCQLPPTDFVAFAKACGASTGEQRNFTRNRAVHWDSCHAIRSNQWTK